MSGNFCLNSDFHVNLGIFYMPQIYDMGPTDLLPLRGFFRPKNPTASAGFEPANLGTKVQHATPTPPKPHGLTSLCKKCDDIIICAGSGHHLRPDRTEPGAPYFGKSFPVYPLLRVTTIRRTTDTNYRHTLQTRTTDRHYRHIPLHFSHNERTPVQISLQYLHWCSNY